MVKLFDKIENYNNFTAQAVIILIKLIRIWLKILTFRNNFGNKFYSIEGSFLRTNEKI